VKHLLRLGIGLVVIAAVLVLAVLTNFRRQEKLEHFYTRVVFQRIADRVTQGAADPQSSVLRLLDYVHAQVLAPPNDRPVGDIEPLEILAAGRGWCDQGANVFAQLARTLPLDVRLVFLRDERGRSPHSVAEVYFDEGWRVVDPLVGIPIFDRRGKLVTRHEVAEDPTLLIKAPDVKLLMELGVIHDFKRQASWYQNEPTLFNSWRGKRKGWLDQIPEPVRRMILCVIQDFYFQLPIATRGLSAEERLMKRAHHYTFLGRTRAAEQIYARLIAQPKDKTIRQDARYFLGCYYAQIGRFDEALKIFNLSLQEEPATGWSPYIYLSIGKIYESLKKRDEALEAYQHSGLATTDTFVAKRMVELKRNN